MLREGETCPCVGSAANYRAPVLDDELELELGATSAGKKSLGLAMTARRTPDSAIVVHSVEWHGWAEFSGDGERRTLAPAPLPGWLRDALAAAPLCQPPHLGRPSSAHPQGGTL